MNDPRFLDARAIAQRLDVSWRTVRNYHTTATKRRNEGTSRPWDFPPPDERFGNSPVWLESTIEKWENNRPGSGTGGGRPPVRPGTRMRYRDNHRRHVLVERCFRDDSEWVVLTSGGTRVPLNELEPLAT